jgi:hypothetical protein
MTRTLRTVLTALLVIGLVAGGAGAAAAEDVDATTASDSTTVINDDDIGDSDNSFNNITGNVLGVQNDDSPLTVLF